MKTTWVLAVAASAGVLACTPLARADIILPGQKDTTLTQQGTLGAPPNITSVAPTPFSFDGITGTYREFVFSGRNGNPLGGLSFEYQFTVTSNTGSAAVASFAATGFAGWQTNVTFAPAGTVPPGEADRSAGLGDVITFVFPGGVGAASGTLPVTTEWMIVDTNAPSFTPNAVTLSDTGGGSLTAAADGPVPEPGTLPLALVSLLLAGAYCGYRRLARRPALA